MQTQVIIFLLLFGGVQGLLFSLFLFRKKLHRNGYIFLLVYMGVMLLQLTLKLMNKLWLMDNWGLLYSLSHFLPLLYGPLAWLFVRDMVEHKKITVKLLWHFLPLFFILVIIILDEYQMIPSTLGYILFNPHMRLVILLISLITYHIVAFGIWKQQKLLLKDNFSETSRLQMNWLRSFVLLSFIVCCFVVATLYLLYINYPNGHEYRYGFAALCIFIYWISYTALNQPVIFSVVKGYADNPNDHFPKLVVHRPPKKYANSTLDEKEKKRICSTLDILVKENKIYLDAELTIDILAENISCSRHSLSQVLNECMRQSFYDYINHYRVEAAKLLLSDEARKAHKIASIAFDAGFNSISTFNEVFKKISGCTPSQFRRSFEEQLKKQRV